MSKDWIDLEGKVVIVTGGDSGIGSHITETLQSNGANVIVADLNVKTEEKSSNLYTVQTDVTSKKSVENMVHLAVEKYNRIDALVNNAGVNLPRLLVDVKGEKPEYEIDEKDFDFMVNVNQKGPVLCAQAATRQFLKQDSGVIVNVTSEAGMEGSAGQSIYSATKGALNGLTRSWAKELGEHNIRVVGVAPGINEKTGLTTDAYNEALAYTRNTTVEELGSNYSSSIPLGRVGKLDEIADLVTYLVSDHSSYITGTTINISGGKSRG